MTGTGLTHWMRRAALTLAPLLVLGAAAAPAHAAAGAARPAALAIPGGWWHHRQAAEFTAPDGQDNAFYGSTVAISANGSTAVVGEFGDSTTQQGAAYVYSSAGGSWALVAELHASDGGAGDGFGWSVAISSDGQTILVGADDINQQTGAAYVFSGSGGSWTQTAELTASDAAAGNGFGYSVALSASGSRAVIGAWGYEGYTGSAYVFYGAGRSWKQKVEMSPLDGNRGNEFGWSVAMSSNGTAILVGAIGNPAYVYTVSGGTWGQAGEIIPSAGSTLFGFSVAMSGSGTTLAIGDYGAGPDGTTYLYTGSGSAWTLTATLTTGATVALSRNGRTLVIGDEGSGANTGVAHVYVSTGGSWVSQGKLTASDGAKNSEFSYSVAVSAYGAVAVLGAPGTDDSTGTAYVFDR
jgi:hypothetical protein